MKKIIESLKDLYTTIPASIAAIFALLQMFGLMPDYIAAELPDKLTEVVLGILSIFMIFKTRKT